MRTSDGIICIGGEDWWYHNRGHYDFQMMQRLARRVPVLFVNSIGVRVPNPVEGGLFARRMARKLASIRRGLVEARPGFWVVSPTSVPGRLGRGLTNPLLAAQIRLAARRAGISRPLLWVHCPPGADLVDMIPHEGLVFQRTDRFEAIPDGNRDDLTRQIATMRARADLTVYCARSLIEEERELCRAATLIDHGIDAAQFGDPERLAAAEPDDLAAIARPRAGFVGSIDARTFDPELLNAVAARLPDVQFVLVGASQLAGDWCRLGNVHMLGRKPFEQVGRYMAGCDVLVMPWNDGEWIQACHPVKLKEYLATGRPVVSTPFPELAGYAGLVSEARTPEAFAGVVAAALKAPGDAAARRARVAGHTWEAKAKELVAGLAGRGISLTRPRSDGTPQLRPAGGEAARTA